MTEDHEGSSFSHHIPCPACDSSDANSMYDDGHTYCFSCKAMVPADNSGDTVAEEEADENLIRGQFKYLKKRRIAINTCRKYNYKVAKYSGTSVQVANYYQSGNRVAQHLRFPDKDFIWLGNSKKLELFGQHLWQAGGRRIVITEGEIDCMTIAQMQGLKWPVVSLPSGANSAEKAIKHNMEFLESFGEIVLAFDADDPGRDAVEVVASLLTPGKVKVMHYNGFKDANEMLQADQADKLIGCMFQAEDYRPDGIVNGDGLLDLLLEPPILGLDGPYPFLNGMLKGFKRGEIYMWTAGSGIGKSTVVHEVAHHFAKEYNQKIGIMAMEESVKGAMERHVGIHLNHPLHLDREGITDEMLTEAHGSIFGKSQFEFYDHFGSSQIDRLLSKVRYLAVGLGCDWIILDHISIVVSGLDEIGESERKTIDKLMTNLRGIVENTGVGLHAVVHLKRANKGKSFNEGRAVSLTDLRGSASLEQLSDAVIALERDQQDEENANISLVRVLKNRRAGITGLADTLEYNQNTGRLIEANGKIFEDDKEENQNAF